MKNDVRCVTSISNGQFRDSRFLRCACGCSGPFRKFSYSYEDGTQSRLISCKECSRTAEIEGDSLDELAAVWNDMNKGTIQLVYSLDEVPKTITIYSKCQEDVESLLKEELFQRIRVHRMTVPELEEIAKCKRIADDADMIVRGYAFTWLNDHDIEVVSLDNISHKLWMHSDGQVYENRFPVIEMEIIKDIWAKNAKFMEPFSEEGRFFPDNST